MSFTRQPYLKNLALPFVGGKTFCYKMGNDLPFFFLFIFFLSFFFLFFSLFFFLFSFLFPFSPSFSLSLLFFFPLYIFTKIYLSFLHSVKYYFPLQTNIVEFLVRRESCFMYGSVPRIIL